MEFEQYLLESPWKKHTREYSGTDIRALMQSQVSGYESVNATKHLGSEKVRTEFFSGLQDLIGAIYSTGDVELGAVHNVTVYKTLEQPIGVTYVAHVDGKDIKERIYVKPFTERRAFKHLLLDEFNGTYRANYVHNNKDMLYIVEEDIAPAFPIGQIHNLGPATFTKTFKNMIFDWFTTLHTLGINDVFRHKGNTLIQERSGVEFAGKKTQAQYDYFLIDVSEHIDFSLDNAKQRLTELTDVTNNDELNELYLDAKNRQDMRLKKNMKSIGSHMRSLKDKKVTVAARGNSFNAGEFVWKSLSRGFDKKLPFK